MKKEKYYFGSKEDEWCYNEDYFQTIMSEHNISFCEVYEAEKDTLPSDMMFCKEHLEFGETGKCGEICEQYQPRNGKSGCCVHYSKAGFTAGNKVKLIHKPIT